MERLSATLDMNGNTISVGDKVRSFDFPLMTKDGEVLGMETECTNESRVSYVVGVVEEIGKWMDGCPRYVIKVESDVCWGYGKDYGPCYEPGTLIYPPVNGTPSTLSEQTFGVVKVGA